MIRQDILDSLVDEVDDSLRVGPVGLYEFFWTLRGEYGDHVREEEFEAYSAAALSRLMAGGRATLVWEVWNDPSAERDAAGHVVTTEDWAGPTDRPFLAVVSVPGSFAWGERGPEPRRY